MFSRITEMFCVGFGKIPCSLAQRRRSSSCGHQQQTFNPGAVTLATTKPTSALPGSAVSKDAIIFLPSSEVWRRSIFMGGADEGGSWGSFDSPELLELCRGPRKNPSFELRGEGVGGFTRFGLLTPVVTLENCASL